jgi:hypothetical protein
MALNFIRILQLIFVTTCLGAGGCLASTWIDTGPEFETLSDGMVSDRSIHSAEKFIGEILFHDDKAVTMAPSDYLARKALAPEARQKLLSYQTKRLVLARRLDMAFSEDQLLMTWLSQTYFGEGNYGLEAAAGNLFGKTLPTLSDEELVAISALTISPSYFLNNPDVWQKKQDELVKAAHSQSRPLVPLHKRLSPQD